MRFLFIAVRRQSWRCALLAAAGLALGGCAQAAHHVPAASARQKVAPPSNRDIAKDPRFQVMAGELALQRGLADQAVRHYMAASAISDDPALAKRAARLALLTNHNQAARRAAEKWVNAAPQDAQAREVSARLAVAAGDPTAATRDAKAVIRLNADGPEAAFHDLILLFGGETKHADTATTVMGNLARAYPSLAMAQYGLGALQMHAGRYRAAAASADRALAIDSSFSDAYLLKAGSLLKQGDKPAADALMQRAYALQPKNLDLRVGYAKLLLKSHKKAAARDQSLSVLKRQADNPEALFTLALIALNDGKLDRARHYLMALRGTGTHPNSSAYYLGRLEEAAGNNRRALKWYKQVGTGDRALDAALRRAVLLQKLGRTNDALDFVVQVRNNNPGLAHRLYLLQGEILVDAQRYSQAIHVFDSALAQFAGDPDLLYSKAMAEVDAGHVSKAKSHLKTLIEQNPKDARSLNALGYVMLQHGGDLQQARDYIQRALRLTPKDPAVIDSMGWAEYRLDHAALALTYLRRAYKQSPDPEIGAHLGAALWVQGRHAAARKIWQKGLKDDPNNSSIRRLMQQLTGRASSNPS